MCTFKSVFRLVVALGLVLSLSALALPNFASADTLTLPGTETRITADPGDQYHPSISGNYIVFTDDRAGDTDVYYHDIAQGKEVPVIVAPGNQELTGVSGNYIVYTDYRSVDIVVYRVDTGQAVNLTAPDKVAAGRGFNSAIPSIDGNLVAWEDDRDGNVEIYARDLSTNEERRITNSPDGDERPAVGNGVIVWDHCPMSGGNCSIYAYDWAANATSQITSNPGCDFKYPDSDGSKVVYTGNCSSPQDAQQNDLYLFDLTTGAEKRLDRPAGQTNGYISGDFVSFDEWLSPTSSHVKLWHTPTNTVFDIPFAPNTNQYLNDIDGNRIVYTNDPGQNGNLDIYMYTFQVSFQPPVTTAAAVPLGPAGKNGWQTSDVKVTLTATDGGSGWGIKEIHYQVGSASEVVVAGASTEFVVGAEGSTDVRYWAVDNGGGTEAAKTLNVKIDKTAPAASPAPSPVANTAGWNNSDVTVTWNWADTGGSGLDPSNCTTNSSSSGEGTLTLTATCQDVAGNVGSASYAVKVDTTRPTITAAATTAPNAAGWYNGDVIVHFTCTDGGSGIPTGKCPADRKLTAEGTSVSSTAQTVTDAAGNISLPSNVVPVKIDKTAPIVTYANHPATYTVDQVVNIACTATDALSGIASTTCQSINGPAYSFSLGTNTFTASATDKAGNTGTSSTAWGVQVTCGSLGNLTLQFLAHRTLGGVLQSRLNAVCAATNPQTKAQAIQAYIWIVQYIQAAGDLTADQAAVLIRLAKAL